jgi:acyl carrier protein
MELVMYVGSTFGVQVEPTEITPDNFDSVAKLANYIRRKKGEAS